VRSELRRFVDPAAADRQAKADQRKLIARFGGREQAFRIGTKKHNAGAGLSRLPRNARKLFEINDAPGLPVLPEE